MLHSNVMQNNAAD